MNTLKEIAMTFLFITGTILAIVLNEFTRHNGKPD